jgi:hypothetical protein
VSVSGFLLFFVLPLVEPGHVHGDTRPVAFRHRPRHHWFRGRVWVRRRLLPGLHDFLISGYRPTAVASLSAVNKAKRPSSGADDGLFLKLNGKFCQRSIIRS